MSGINFKKTLGIAENDANVVSLNLDKKEKALHKKPKMDKKRQDLATGADEQEDSAKPEQAE